MSRKRKRPARARRAAPAVQPTQAGSPPEAKPARRSRPALRWAVRLAGLLLPIVLLLGLELALRIGGYGYPTSFFVASGRPDTHATNPQYGWRFFPPALARTPVVSLLAAGKPERGYRIFVLGESAAMGTPDPAFGFGRILEAMLRESFPAVDVEVVNAAMTAINSYVVREIGREAAHHQPDLFIIYMGNNEVVGPYGPATVFAGYSPGLPAIRWSIRFKGTRTGQLVDRAVRRVAAREAPARWRGMEMFLDERIAADDRRLETVYAHFRRNLDDLIGAATRAGAEVIVSTVATNLLDSPPFASLAHEGLAGADAVRVDRLHEEGAELLAAGRAPEAAALLEEALAIDDRRADRHFQLGRALLAAGRHDEAGRHLTRARDLDALRFRADSRINDAIRSAAAGAAPKGVRLVDAERLLAGDDGTGPGADLLWDHVHFTWEGNYRLAKALFADVAPLVAARAGVTAVPAAPSPERCAERLVLTDWDRARMTAAMIEMVRRPPFSGQLGHRERLDALRRELQVEAMRARAALDAIERAYRTAAARTPDDLLVGATYAALLRERGRHAAAADEWRRLLGRAPAITEWRAQLAFVLADQASASDPPDRVLLAEATAMLRAIVREQPDLPAAHVNLGNVLSQQGETDEAAIHYREALRLNPAHEVARLNLASILAARGRFDEAAVQCRQAIAIDPDSSEAHGRLAAILEQSGDLDGAIASYRRALEVDPDLARVRNRLAHALEQQDRTEEAMREYRAAIDRDPDYPLPRFNLADLLLREGRTREAIPLFRAGLELQPGHLPARYNLAVALQFDGDPTAAASEFRRILEAEADHPGALINLAWILATAPARGLRDPVEAVRLAERAVAVAGGAPEALETLAAAYAAAGRFDAAAQAAERGLEAARTRGDVRRTAALEQQVREYRARAAH